MLLADRTEAQAINDSLAFTIQCNASVSNMSQLCMIEAEKFEP